MRRTLCTAFLVSLTLAACNGSGGTTEVSKRPPRGNANAPVVVEEFADLQCPACRAAHSAIHQPLVAEYGDRVRFEFQHFPLRNLHRYALDAAEASECAADQGKFWEFVDRVYEEQEDLGPEGIVEWAEDLGLDMTLFRACTEGHDKRDLVLSEYAAGRERGVSGTPTFFVNGTRVETGVDTIGAAIEAELKKFTQRL